MLPSSFPRDTVVYDTLIVDGTVLIVGGGAKELFSNSLRPSSLVPIVIVVSFLQEKTGGCISSADWVLDEDELLGAFNEKTKMIILNTPHNPLGKVFTRKELERIADLCKKWNVLCLSDEVYEWMVYRPNEHIRMGTCTRGRRGEIMEERKILCVPTNLLRVNTQIASEWFFCIFSRGFGHFIVLMYNIR